jgi:hypothetical protein
MKAEERKKLERNALAEKLTHAWEGVSGSSATANRVWTIILAVLVAALIWVVYSRYMTGRETGLWSRLDSAYDLDSLRSLAREFPNSTQGQIARFQIARVQFADHLNKIASQTADERLAAANAIEEVRKNYAELAKISSLPTTMIQEAMLQTARADEVLASIPKADDPNTMRSSIETAIKGYEELKNKYPKSIAGEHAAKRIEELRKHKDEVARLNAELAKDQGKTLPGVNLPVGVVPEAPELPKLPPAETPKAEIPNPEAPKSDGPKSETPKADAPR